MRGQVQGRGWVSGVYWPGSQVVIARAAPAWAPRIGGTPLKVIWLFPQRSGLSRPRLRKQAGFQQVVGDAMPDINAHAADDTRKLRARFPRWGILFDPVESVWVAVRGKRTLVAASSPEKLTEQVEAAARGEAGPDEGEKTQTWRALRKHGRG